MKKFNETMHDLGESTHLSAEEKSAMRSRVHEYMQHVPVRGTQQAHSVSTSVWLRYRFAAATLIVALVFTSGVGVTYASNNALPGDRLYTVKEVSEEVTEALIFNPEKKAAFVVERAHRRLQEAERLALRGTLNEQTEEFVQQRFEHFTQRANKRIAHLETVNPAEAEALRAALEIGTEARAERLAQRIEDISDEQNSARVRIAQVVHRTAPAHKKAPLAVAMDSAVEDVVMESTAMAAPEVVAPSTTLAFDEAVEAPKIAVSSIKTRVTAPPANIAEREEVETHTSPQHIAALVRALQKQKERIKNIQNKRTDLHEELAELLEEVTDIERDMTRAISAGQYAKADELVREALKLIHETRAQLDTRVEVETKSQRMAAPIQDQKLER